MPVGCTLFSCQEVVDYIGGDERAATRSMQLVLAGLPRAIGSPTAWSPTARPDRVTRAFVSWCRKAGKLADGDPEKFSAMVMDALAALEGE